MMVNLGRTVAQLSWLMATFWRSNNCLWMQPLDFLSPMSQMSDFHISITPLSLLVAFSLQTYFKRNSLGPCYTLIYVRSGAWCLGCRHSRLSYHRMFRSFRSPVDHTTLVGSHPLASSLTWNTTRDHASSVPGLFSIQTTKISKDSFILFQT